MSTVDYESVEDGNRVIGVGQVYVAALGPCRRLQVAPAPGTVIQWEAEMLKQPFGEVLRLERVQLDRSQ